MLDDERSGLPHDFALETVDLAVSDVARARAFYERVIGLEALKVPAEADGNRDVGRRADPGIVLGGVRRPIVRLRGGATASASTPNATGLFHLAVLVPTRADLADFVAALVEARTPIVGVADHGVSEAIYLEDVDGHGVEVYADRLRDDWPMRRGRIAMTTDPLDVDGLLAEAAPVRARGAGHAVARPWGAPSGTQLGHVHLRVRDVDEALAFYREVVGFDEVASLPGAAFLSVGGYHHHLGVNAWQSAGGSPVEPGAPRLERVRASVGSDDALRALRERLGSTASQPEDPRVAEFLDPSGVAWRVVVRDRTSR